MADRSAIVTGAGAGFGAAFDRRIAQDDIHVLVNTRHHGDRPLSAEAVLLEISAMGGLRAINDHAADTPSRSEAIVRTAAERFGGLDVLILNAGFSGPAVKVGDGDTDLRKVMDIKFFGNACLVEVALPHLRNSPAGRIVFVSSTGGLHGVHGRTAYAASKGALNAYALSLADELRREDILVNMLAPYAETKMTARPDRQPDPRMGALGRGGCVSPTCERCV